VPTSPNTAEVKDSLTNEQKFERAIKPIEHLSNSPTILSLQSVQSYFYKVRGNKSPACPLLVKHARITWTARLRVPPKAGGN